MNNEHYANQKHHRKSYFDKIFIHFIKNSTKYHHYLQQKSFFYLSADMSD